MEEKQKIDFDETKKKINQCMDDILTAEGVWFKKIEEMRNIYANWEMDPDDEEENRKKMELSRAIDSGVVYALRQALMRYGNLLFA